MALRLFRKWADQRLRRRCETLIELSTAYVFLRVLNDLAEHDERPDDRRDWAVALTHHLLGTRPTAEETRRFFDRHASELSVSAATVRERDGQVRAYAGMILRVRGVLTGPPEGQTLIDRADEIDLKGRLPSGKRMQAIISNKNFRWLAQEIEKEKARGEA